MIHQCWFFTDFQMPLMFCSNSCFVMADSFRGLTLQNIKALKACIEEFYREYRPLAFAGNFTSKITDILARRLKYALQFGPESKVLWGTEGKTDWEVEIEHRRCMSIKKVSHLSFYKQGKLFLDMGTIYFFYCLTRTILNCSLMF